MSSFFSGNLEPIGGSLKSFGFIKLFMKSWQM
jgi:hypothetical protein